MRLKSVRAAGATRFSPEYQRVLDELTPGVRVKRRRSRPEEDLQKCLVAYLKAVLPKGWIVHHSRNGGLSKGENGRAKAMGARKGFPDLQILGRRDIGQLLANMQPFVLMIEVKCPGGHPDSDQRKLHEEMRALGFPVEVVRSLDDLKAVLRKYRIATRDAEA